MVKVYCLRAEKDFSELEKEVNDLLNKLNTNLVMNSVHTSYNILRTPKITTKYSLLEIPNEGAIYYTQLQKGNKNTLHVEDSPIEIKYTMLLVLMGFKTASEEQLDSMIKSRLEKYLLKSF